MDSGNKIKPRIADRDFEISRVEKMKRSLNI